MNESRTPIRSGRRRRFLVGVVLAAAVATASCSGGFGGEFGWHLGHASAPAESGSAGV